MPALPTIVPIIIVGIMVGSLLKSEKPKISFRRVVLSALVAGALNAAWAYSEIILTPQPTSFGTTATAFLAARSVSPLAFSGASFLAAFLIVLAVFVVAAVFLRVRGGGSEFEEPDLHAEEEPKLKTG